MLRSSAFDRATPPSSLSHNANEKRSEEYKINDDDDESNFISYCHYYYYYCVCTRTDDGTINTNGPCYCCHRQRERPLQSKDDLLQHRRRPKTALHCTAPCWAALIWGLISCESVILIILNRTTTRTGRHKWRRERMRRGLERQQQHRTM